MLLPLHQKPLEFTHFILHFPVQWGKFDHLTIASLGVFEILIGEVIITKLLVGCRIFGVFSYTFDMLFFRELLS